MIATCVGCGHDVDLDSPPSVVHEEGCPWVPSSQYVCPCKRRGADAGKGSDGDTAWCSEQCRLLTTGDYMKTPIGVVAIADVWSWFESEPEEEPPDE